MCGANSRNTYRRKLLSLVGWLITMTLFTEKTFWCVSSPFDVILLLQDQCLRQLPLTLSKERGREFAFTLRPEGMLSTRAAY